MKYLTLILIFNFSLSFANIVKDLFESTNECHYQVEDGGKFKNAQKLSYLVICDDIAFQKLEYKFDFYFPQNFTGAVSFITPPRGGLSPVDKALTKKLIKRGQGIIVVPLTHDFDELSLLGDKYFNTFYVQNIFSMKKSLDIVINNYPVDMQEISAFGISLGGIRTISYISYDQRVKKTILMVASHKILEVISTSKNKFIKSYREDVVDNDNEYRDFDVEYLNPDFKAEPSDFMMFIAKKDKMVNARFQWSLWERLGRPRLYTGYGHRTATLEGYLFRKREIINFLLP